MKIHTTTHGDRFLQTHIVQATAWSHSAYRAPARHCSAGRVSRFLRISAITLAALAAITFLSR